MTVTVQLRQPIEAHGDQVTELEFREPKPSDIAASGFPMAVSGDGALPQPAAINALISRLAKIPPSSVDQLLMSDWSDCMGAVMSFFGGSPSSDSSTEHSSSPGGGESVLQ